MTPVVCLGAGALDYPEGKGGGHTWVYLNWALGLRALGCRVIWLESVPPRISVDVTRERLTILRRYLEPHGFEEIALASSNGEAPPRELIDQTVSCADVAAEAARILADAPIRAAAPAVAGPFADALRDALAPGASSLVRRPSGASTASRPEGAR